MANLIVLCPREKPARTDLAGDLLRCADALAPDNILAHPAIVQERDGVGTAIVNPVPGIDARAGGVCLGRTFGSVGEWWAVGGETPDGTYVIARHDARTVEVLTDVLATRQLWYVHTPDLFAASTSQRALVMLLRSFDLNRETVTWMLAAGHLGGASWDGRLRKLAGDSRVVLDRERWRVDVHERPADREPLPVSDAEHVERLRQAVLETCAGLHLPHDEWLLPLSGGLDSRMLLLGLVHAGERPRCVTWGLRASLLEKDNDAYIARELARTYGVEHRYLPTDESAEPMGTALRRFLVASEGQIRDFGAYTDGMAMWKGFFEAGEAGVIRGDEPGMGYWSHYDSEGQIRQRKQLTLVTDYPASHPIRRLELADQQLDDRLRRRPGESLTSYDVRLYEESACPDRLAPLNAIKTAYVEIVNPLAGRRVTEVARRLPDHLLVDRKSLRAVVAALGPDLPTAKAAAPAGTPALWRDEAGLAAMVSALSAEHAERVLARPALDLVIAGLTAGSAAPASRRRARRALKAVVPRSVVQRVRPVPPPRLSGRELGFRAYLAVEAADLLARDAAALPRERR